MSVDTLQITDAKDLEQAARQAGRVFTDGGLVVFPTETVYGIGAVATSERGIAALQAFKQRSADQPFTVHIATPQDAARYVDDTQPRIMRLIRKVFPGPVTLVVDVPASVIDAKSRQLGLSADIAKLIWRDGAVGLRCPDHDAARRILGATDAPVLASSANRHGQPPPTDAQHAAAETADVADLIVDGGACRHRKPSTIIHVHEPDADPPYTVVREGVFDRRYVTKLLRWTMLIVCSGNTCRSPMAAAIAKDILAKQHGLEPDKLEAAGLNVVSAGIYAGHGAPASPEAVKAMQDQGIDLTTHRSQPVTPELVHEADAIYCMTDTHLQAVKAMTPAAEGKTFLLDPNGNVEDPIGEGLSIYRRCAELFRRRLVQRLKEQQV